MLKLSLLVIVAVTCLVDANRRNGGQNLTPGDFYVVSSAGKLVKVNPGDQLSSIGGRSGQRQRFRRPVGYHPSFSRPGGILPPYARPSPLIHNGDVVPPPQIIDPLPSVRPPTVGPGGQRPPWVGPGGQFTPWVGPGGENPAGSFSRPSSRSAESDSSESAEAPPPLSIRRQSDVHLFRQATWTHRRPQGRPSGSRPIPLRPKFRPPPPSPDSYFSRSSESNEPSLLRPFRRRPSRIGSPIVGPGGQNPSSSSSSSSSSASGSASASDSNSESREVAGGLGPAQAPDAHIVELVDLLKHQIREIACSKIKCLKGGSYSKIKVLNYRTQVVSGSLFHVKILLDRYTFFAKIYESPWDKILELQGVNGPIYD